MASAISETLEATSERASAEAAIRAENDALAHEHVRLKRLGLITDLIQTSDVHTDKLTRDRSANVDPELAELKQSIQSVGLSNPIRVEQTDNGYELIQGFRRLTAFRELAAETGDPRYSRIPAALVPRGNPSRICTARWWTRTLCAKICPLARWRGWPCPMRRIRASR